MKHLHLEPLWDLVADNKWGVLPPVWAPDRSEVTVKSNWLFSVFPSHRDWCEVICKLYQNFEILEIKFWNHWLILKSSQCDIFGKPVIEMSWILTNSCINIGANSTQISKNTKKYIDNLSWRMGAQFCSWRNVLILSSDSQKRKILNFLLQRSTARSNKENVTFPSKSFGMQKYWQGTSI